MAANQRLGENLLIWLLLLTTSVTCQTIGNSINSTTVTIPDASTTPPATTAATNQSSLMSQTTASVSVSASPATPNVNSSSSSLTFTSSSTTTQTVKAESVTNASPVNENQTAAPSVAITSGSAVPSDTPTTAKPKDCHEQLMQVDGCIKRIVLIGDREAVIPKTVKELEDNHCNRIRGELVCVREYGRVCLKLFPRTIFAIVRKNVEKVFKSFCTTASGKMTAVKHFGCFKPENLRVLHSVVDKITHTLQFIEKNTTDVQIIPYMCCAFYTFYHETQIIVDNMCLNATGAETSEFIINIIKAAVTDALDLGCGQYGSYKKCTENLPAGVQVYTEIFQQNKYENSTLDIPAFSPVIPMIAIAKRLDSGF